MNENLEDVLRESLRREAPPADFAAKVLAKAGAEAPRATLSVVAGNSAKKPWQRRSFTLALAATLAAVAIVPAVVLDYQHKQEEARGLKAKQDLLTALAITRDQLQQAREKVRRTTRIIQ